jgi:membrane protein YdbS with pleckstrin-like domain
MSNPELISFINTQIASNIPIDAIKLSLRQAGWPENEIEMAFSEPVTQPTSFYEHPSTDIQLTEKDFPITTLWVFKGPIIYIVISVIALLFGYWFPALVLLIPYWLIANPLQKKNFHFHLDSQYFVVKQGVFSKQQRNIPYAVMQHVFVKQDLYDRLFGIATLVIENATTKGSEKKFFGMTIGSTNQSKGYNESLGTIDNKVSLPGLKKEHAEALKNHLLDKIKQNPLEDNQSGL